MENELPDTAEAMERKETAHTVPTGWYLLFFGLIAWHGSSMVMQSWTSGSRSQSALQTPTVIPQSIWILGLAVFVVIGALLFLHALILLGRGRVAEATGAISTRSAEEEVAAEIRDLEDRQSREAGAP